VFYGWVLVLVVGLGGFSASTEALPVLGIFLKPITEEFGWTRATFTLPLTIGGIAGGGAAILTGPIVDRFGSRWALVAAYGVLGIAFAMMSVMENIWHFYALQMVARSMNTGVMAVATAVVIPNWFIARRGRALSLSNLGFPIGAAIIPLFVQALISSSSWRPAAFGVGMLILIVSMVPTALFMRRRPEDMGLLPDGRPPDIRTASPEEPTPRPMVSDVSLTLREAFREPSFYLISAAGFFWWFGRGGLVLHVVAYLTDSGLSPGLAVVALSMQSGFGAAGALLAGFLRDHFNVRYVLAADFALNGIGLVILLCVGPAWVAIVWSIVYGIAQGGSVPLQRLIFADYFGRQHLGSIEGVVRAAQNIAQATGPLAAALAYDATNSYRSIFGVFVLASMTAMVLVLIARPPAHARDAEDNRTG
jgi:sugar phosphate permease